MTFHSVGNNHPTRGVGIPPIMTTWQLQSRGFAEGRRQLAAAPQDEELLAEQKSS